MLNALDLRPGRRVPARLHREIHRENVNEPERPTRLDLPTQDARLSQGTPCEACRPSVWIDVDSSASVTRLVRSGFELENG